MAYAFTPTGPTVHFVDGVKHGTWEIDETEVDTASTWKITHVPELGTITLYEVHLATGGDAASIAPELGIVDAWTAGSLDEIAQTTPPNTHVRVQSDQRYFSADNTLVGRSKPNVATGATGNIKTRITVRWGH